MMNPGYRDGTETVPILDDMMEQFSGVLKPDYIISFKLDKKAALQKHYGGKQW